MPQHALAGDSQVSAFLFLFYLVLRVKAEGEAELFRPGLEKRRLRAGTWDHAVMLAFLHDLAHDVLDKVHLRANIANGKSAHPFFVWNYISSHSVSF